MHDLSQLPADRQQALVDYLTDFITAQRREKMDRVLAQRTRHLAVVLEDIFQPHNASAVLRSCECFGVQDVHIIENRYTFTVNKDVVMGANKWLTMMRYRDDGDNTAHCLEKLRAAGYRLAATALSDRAIPLPELDLDQPTALLFGTELTGLSTVALDAADVHVRIPMAGFTQSFNISVSAALGLYDLTTRLRASNQSWQLSAAERMELLLSWLMQAVRRPDVLENWLAEQP